MPLLPMQPFVFPDGIFADESAQAPPSRWCVLHTRPRAEKALARRLISREHAFFLPIHKHTWRHAGRLLTSYLPLFPGYLFLRDEGRSVLTALESNLVARVLKVDDQAQLHTDLARIHRLIFSGAPLTPEANLRPGSDVEIIAGPFTGLKGKILRRGKQLKFQVEVRLVHQGVSVEIESWMFQLTGRQFQTNAMV
jgi:transcriptional antiterminator RfaH